MATVTFITPDGKEHRIGAADGSLMEVAVDNEIEGIHGNCGGVCSCSTCHVKVHPDWLDKVGPATEIESDVFGDDRNTDQRSRLSCQILMSEELDGLVVEVVELM